MAAADEAGEAEMGEFALGQPVPRFEDPRLLRGGGRYVDDFVLPRMAFGYVLRSPHAHARIRAIDTSRAKQAPGVLAVLTGPAQAVRCAQRIVAEARTAGLEVRTGVHTGEVERVGDDVAGLAVHLAARIMANAGPGEVLVSRTVKDLVVGSELRFDPRGEHELKGFDEPWAIYAVG